MTIHTRELCPAASGPADTIGDAWRLVFNEEVRTLRVEYGGARGVGRQKAKTRNGARTYDLEDFLSRTHADDSGARLAKERLIGMLKELFEPRNPIA